MPSALALALCAAPAVLAADAAMADAETKLEQIVVGSPTKIEVFPESFKLDSPRRKLHLVVTGYYADGTHQDLTRACEVVSADENGARAEQAVVSPVADGNTQVTVKAGGHEVAVPVEVVGQQTPDRISFDYDTLAVLSKQGCNQGACHGSPSGKGGFRLSLRAYDPALDIETLVREAFNRRTNLYEPEKSLLLRKPLMEVAHGGGRRLTTDSLAYEVLHDWIDQGCQVDPPEAAECVKLDIYPRERILMRPAHTQQVVALAHFSDGTIRDVTSLACFSSSDEAVATVDETGLVVGHDRGEAAILVRYLDKLESSTMMFLKEVPGFEWSNPPENNFVDQHVFDKLEQLQILPSDVCTDEEFIRRVYLDVIGVLPKPAETKAFLADSDPEKRAKLIDELLERPEFAEFWALKWGDLLRIRNAKVTNSGVHKFHRWLVAAFRDNMPYDQFARELLTASGSTFVNPPANYYRTATETNDCTETTSQLFLGIRIQCAKCHNHPFERWSQDNYYGIGAFFNRVQRKPGVNPDEQVIWVARGGEVTQPRTGQQMQPWLPLTGTAELSGEDDRRDALVDWLVKPENPFFAKVEVNRIWGHLLGRGIVEPVDDFRDSNPPSSESLIAALADDFAAHGYDRKHVIRTVLNSRTYQLSSRKNEFNAEDGKYFSHAMTRLLTAEQLLDAICRVTDVPEKFAGLPAGTRATALPSPDVESDFLKVFGQPARETACQCERSTDSNLSQALQMINGPLVHSKVRDEKNRIRTLATSEKSNEEIITELYLAGLCREPSEPEMAAATRHIEKSGDRMRGLEDVCWALLNANEFLFQH
ncbi:MAG: DUF1549 domain-containing protein [Planctomycetota bacterium]|nr:MAG: DUF1549 domain-containing protein [Planctomycetota bacterium]